MIAVGETTAALRRIYLTIYVDDGSVLSVDAATAPPVGTIKVSLNGGAFTNAAGSLTHLGSGVYYYEASAGEVASTGFLAVKYERAAYRTEIDWAPVGNLFSIGETNAAALRLPLTIYDTASPPALATGATVSVGDLKTSINGSALANAAGTLVAVGSGLYYYQAVSADAASGNSLLVKYEHAGFGVAVAWTSIDAAPVTPGAPTPVLSNVSPVPFTDPGAPLAFSVDFRAARLTPIEFDVTGVDGKITVTVAYSDRNEPYTGLDVDGVFRWPFDVPADNAIGDLLSEPVHVRMLPRGGWPPTVVHFQVANAKATA